MSVVPSAKPLVLVVDDDVVNQMLLTEVCRAEGFDVLTAGDGEAALETFASRDVDLVLLDVAMPKLDGFTVCRRIQALRPVPVIIVTATSERTAETQASDCGAVAFVTKPFRVFELSRKMRAALRPSLSPSSPPSRAEHEQRLEAARALGTVGGALQLRVALRNALVAEGRFAVVLARLENEREILLVAGRTARDAAIGTLCSVLRADVPDAELYCSDSNELVAVLPERQLERALTSAARGADEAGELGLGVVMRRAGVRLAPAGDDVDDVLRSLRELCRVGGTGG